MADRISWIARQRGRAAARPLMEIRPNEAMAAGIASAVYARSAEDSQYIGQTESDFAGPLFVPRHGGETRDSPGRASLAL
jgi:hypothetical protein